MERLDCRNFITRKHFLLLGGSLAAAAVMYIALTKDKEGWPKNHVWQYKTDPVHPFDDSVRLLLRPIMLSLADGKISHWWHWRNINPNAHWNGLELEGDPNAFPIRSNRDINMDWLRMSLGGWKTGYVLEPETLVKRWHYCYGDLEGRSVRRCSIVCEGPIRVLTGPDRFRVYGLDASHKEVSLKKSGTILRDDRSIPWPLI